MESAPDRSQRRIGERWQSTPGFVLLGLDIDQPEPYRDAIPI